MKSILAKQAPQISPCLPIRVRHTTQTGGSNISASGARIAPSERPRARACSGRRVRVMSVSLISMDAMIEPNPTKLKERRR
jgi:hypothetical protein